MLVSVLAIDPGGTTGWKWACVDGSMEPTLALRQALANGEVRGGQIEGNENAQVRLIEEFWSSACQRADRLARGTGEEVRRHLVTEGFTLRLMSSDPSLLSPVRILAKLDQMVDEARFGGLDVWGTYEASDAKNVVTDERLKRWGLWVPGQRHQNDACRHLALHLRKTYGD